ncbi:hypothetical protein HLB35_15440 [Halomonas sp. TBZ9]|uniref:Capsule polysaccharide biosynthesis protein n=1 Tax=Vreelandella azerica TaxID=2732867 RepID=A0A7Y3TZ91_9GAMM|nr:hypothetical protein [Halomonas azerica]NOG32799.1 hypothetical protein [Halomonas azerica]
MEKSTLESMAFCDLVKDTASAGYQIILRPHPDEGIDFYRQVFHDYKEVKVSFEGDLSAEIEGASVVVQSGCTSGIESLLAGVTTINYQPCYGSTLSIEGLSDVGDVAKDHNDALRKIIEAYKERSSPEYFESNVLSRIGEASNFIIEKMEESGAFLNKSTLYFPDPINFPQEKDMPEGKEFSYNRELLFGALKKYALASNVRIRVLSSGYNHIIVAPSHR